MFKGDSAKLFHSESLTVQRALKKIKENLLKGKNAEFTNLSKKVNQFHFDIPESINNVEFLNDIQFLQNLKINQKVNTSILINSLIELVVLDKENKITKFWIDLLIQRFEVTKKIYKEYLPGFKKGNGDKTLIKLYWKFALILAIKYSKTKQLKFLNTLIKLCDLIISLPIKSINKEISEIGLHLLILSEITFVKNLLKNKGIEYGHE